MQADFNGEVWIGMAGVVPSRMESVLQQQFSHKMVPQVFAGFSDQPVLLA